MPVPGETRPLPPLPLPVQVRILGDQVSRLDALLGDATDPLVVRHLTQLRDEAQRAYDGAMGRLENLVGWAAAGPEMGRKADLYGEAAFYRRSGGGITTSQPTLGVAQEGGRSIAMEHIK